MSNFRKEIRSSVLLTVKNEFITLKMILGDGSTLCLVIALRKTMAEKSLHTSNKNEYFWTRHITFGSASFHSSCNYITIITVKVLFSFVYFRFYSISASSTVCFLHFPCKIAYRIFCSQFSVKYFEIYVWVVNYI